MNPGFETIPYATELEKEEVSCSESNSRERLSR